MRFFSPFVRINFSKFVLLIYTTTKELELNSEKFLILKNVYSNIRFVKLIGFAEVAQLVERLPSKQAVASSSLVFRSIYSKVSNLAFLMLRIDIEIDIVLV